MIYPNPVVKNVRLKESNTLSSKIEIQFLNLFVSLD